MWLVSVATGRRREATPRRATTPLPPSSAWSHRFGVHTRYRVEGSLAARSCVALPCCLSFLCFPTFSLPRPSLSFLHFLLVSISSFSVLSPSFLLSFFILSSSFLLSFFITMFSFISFCTFYFSSFSLLFSYFPTLSLPHPLVLLSSHILLLSFLTSMLFPFSVPTLTIMRSESRRNSPSTLEAEAPLPCSQEPGRPLYHSCVVQLAPTHLPEHVPFTFCACYVPRTSHPVFDFIII